jgi:3-oxoacyl-[acyl-carrier-protein] synthase II
LREHRIGRDNLTAAFPEKSPAEIETILAGVWDNLGRVGAEFAHLDHINAHGTSTPENDKMEYLATNAVFGEHTSKIPVTSNKSAVGHTISAAGAVEAIFSLLTLEHQRIPPTLNYENPDPAIPFDVVGNKARDARVTAVMSNSFGFGGQNASLILTREPV